MYMDLVQNKILNWKMNILLRYWNSTISFYYLKPGPIHDVICQCLVWNIFLYTDLDRKTREETQVG